MFPGTRGSLSAAVATVGSAATALVAGAAAAAPREYTPASRPRAGMSKPCPAGFREVQSFDRCYAKCARRFVKEVTFVYERNRDLRVRCVPRRTTRIYYGLKLRATFRHEQRGPGIDTAVETHSWTFRPRVPAMTLFRRCAPVLFDANGDEVADDPRLGAVRLDPALKCARHQRRLRKAIPGIRVFEDASLRVNGTIVGGPYLLRRTEGQRKETIWFEGGVRRTAPCDTLLTETTRGTGPLAEPAVLRTATRNAVDQSELQSWQRSTRLRGLELGLTGESTPGLLLHTTSGRTCPKVPDGADDRPFFTGAPDLPPITPEAVPFFRSSGTANVPFFRPNLGDRFGARRIIKTDTIEAGDPKTNPTLVRFTLILQRCKRQSPPSGCKVRG